MSCQDYEFSEKISSNNSALPSLKTLLLIPSSDIYDEGYMHQFQPRPSHKISSRSTPIKDIFS